MKHELGWLPRFLRRAKPVPDDVAALYAERPYLDAYAGHTDLRVDRNPHTAIGGLWEEMGQLQLGTATASTISRTPIRIPRASACCV